MPVSDAIRRLVLERAGERCEYCLIRAWPLTVDHILPRRSGHAEPDHPDNLAAACAPCNRAKSDATTGRDVLTDAEHRLFDPRRMRWADHFAWQADYLEVVGRTPIGRATVARLRLNREIYRRQRRVLRLAASVGGPPWP